MNVPTMVDDLAALVAIESPSSDGAAVAACAQAVAVLGTRLTGTPPQWLTVSGCPHLCWQFGGPTRVLLLGHVDTVWPLGTLDRWPFEVRDGVATGPGCFDMKAGLVQLFHALSGMPDLTGVTVLVTGDEEVGSPTSRELIEQTARGARAALVLEASADGGALKTSRKGMSVYRIEVSGVAAHAGLEPERGVNATVELAHQILALTDLARPDLGTTVTPTVARAGSTRNTVPAAAEVSVDVRAALAREQDRVDRAMRALPPRLAGASVRVRGGPNRPPLQPADSAALFALAVDVARERGLPEPVGAAVGGASDGNLTAGIGVPTLDGLGAVGGGAHAESEHVVVARMPERAALLAGIVDRLLRDEGHQEK